MKGAGKDDHEGDVRKEGRVWREVEGEVERTRGERKKVMVDIHANGTGAYSIRGCTRKGPKMFVGM